MREFMTILEFQSKFSTEEDGHGALPQSNAEVPPFAVLRHSTTWFVHGIEGLLPSLANLTCPLK